MNLIRLPFDGLVKIQLRSFADSRGLFAETFRTDRFSEWELAGSFVQENESRSARGVLRGLHWQDPPFAQAKLIRAVTGSVWDVVVDIRNGSPTFGKHHIETLSAARPEWLFVPAGFAHGFLSLETDSIVQYKVTAPYSPAHERGLRWNDPDLGIPWPDLGQKPLVSDKDLGYPGLRGIRSVFEARTA